MKHPSLGLRWLPVVVVALGAVACPAPGPDPTEPWPRVDAGLPEGKGDAVSAEAEAGTPDAGLADAGSAADTGAITDPGRPSQVFGPKCWGHYGFMQNGRFNQQFPVDCTAYTHSTAVGSHLFLEFGGLGNIATAYASVMLAITPWRPGLYSTAMAGRNEVMLKDGRRFRTYINPGGSDRADVTVQVDTVSAAQAGEPSHTIKGFYQAELRPAPGIGVGASETSLFARIQIDAPALPGR